MRTHIVQEGDTLSSIVDSYFGSPVYGKKGNLLRVIRENPQLRNPNHLKPGEEISLGDGVARVPAAEEVAGVVETSATEETPSASFNRYSYFVLEPLGTFSKIEGVDRTTGAGAILLSDLNLGARVRWYQVWSERVRTFAAVDFLRVRLLEAEAGKTLEGASQTYSAFTLGAETDLFPALSVGGALATRQEIFYRAAGAGTVEIDKVSVPQAELFARFRIIPSTPLGAGLDGRYRLLFSSSTPSYDTNFGTGYEVGAYLEQMLSTMTLGVRTYYSRASYDSSIAEQKRTDLGLGFSIRFEVGKK